MLQVKANGMTDDNLSMPMIQYNIITASAIFERLRINWTVQGYGLGYSTPYRPGRDGSKNGRSSEILSVLSFI